MAGVVSSTERIRSSRHGPQDLAAKVGDEQGAIHMGDAAGAGGAGFELSMLLCSPRCHPSHCLVYGLHVHFAHPAAVDSNVREGGLDFTAVAR